jgi:hypothetical protein
VLRCCYQSTRFERALWHCGTALRFKTAWPVPLASLLLLLQARCCWPPRLPWCSDDGAGSSAATATHCHWPRQASPAMGSRATQVLHVSLTQRHPLTSNQPERLSTPGGRWV